MVGGAAPPIIATKLVDAGNTDAIGYTLAGLSILSLLCVLAMKDSKDGSMTS